MFIWIVTAIVSVLLGRALWLALHPHRDAPLPQEPALRLAIAKETLLSHPSPTHLEQLESVCAELGISCATEDYQVLMERQIALHRSRPADWLAQDSELFEVQALWMDRLTPLELSSKLDPGTPEGFRTRLQGILRLYSDDGVAGLLEDLIQRAPIEQRQTAADLLQSWNALIQLRDTSRADADSLRDLAQRKEAWVQEIQDLLKTP